jgi:hypothetical protein
MERERDASSADLSEQDTPIEDDEPSEEPSSIPADVPEADALEQSRDVPGDDEVRDQE